MFDKSQDVHARSLAKWQETKNTRGISRSWMPIGVVAAGHTATLRDDRDSASQRSPDSSRERSSPQRRQSVLPRLSAAHLRDTSTFSDLSSAPRHEVLERVGTP